MTDPGVDDSSESVIEQLRQLWIMADEDSVNGDLERARLLAEGVPTSRRAEADAFVMALARLERWLRDF